MMVRNQIELQNAFKAIFGSKTLIFEKCKNSCNKTNIFEGGRVSLGAQNRPQEAPRGDQNDIEKRRKKRDEHKSINSEKNNYKKL